MFRKIVEKSAVKTDIQLEKDHKLVCVGKYPICIKFPPLLTFVYPLQNKLILVKNYALLLSPNNPTERKMTVVFAKKRIFVDFAAQNMNIFSANPNHTPRLLSIANM